MSASRPSRRKGVPGGNSKGGPDVAGAGQAKSTLSQEEASASIRDKLLSPNQDWEKDELCDVIHWVRQVLGLVCGVIWGCIPLTGLLPLFGFVLLNTLLVYLYYSQVLKVDDEDFGGTWALTQEGLPPSVALFILSWVLVYTLTAFP